MLQYECRVATLGKVRWCPEPESNRHGLRRGILSPLCLPISPSGPENALEAEEYWRRDPESNRGTRLCRPLHNHSAIAPRPKTRAGNKRGKALLSPVEIWSGRRVSNSRPIPWQGIALPTELLPQIADANYNCEQTHVNGFATIFRAMPSAGSRPSTRASGSRRHGSAKCREPGD